MVVGGKQQSGMLDGTPDKRIFWSIISDYNTITAICELIDNAVDKWRAAADTARLTVTLTLDVDRQIIVVEDNAGGVPEHEMRYLIAPGGSANDPNAPIIGVFGVGSKRASVALAEQVTIRTRSGEASTFQIDITPEWIRSDDWDIPVFEVSPGAEDSTSVTMTALRHRLTEEDVLGLSLHLGAVYATFLQQGGFNLQVNGRPIEPIRFDTWAYPKGHEPRHVQFEINQPGGDPPVNVSIAAGLIRDRVASEDNYGVYFYCNGRLVAKHVKERECGYHSGSQSGVPHPDASLARAIVEFQGPAKLMPWNSSKTGINFSHAVFKSTQDVLLQMVGHYSSLSRRLKSTWEKDVFRKAKGEVVPIEMAALDGKKVHLPELPRVQKTRAEHLVSTNRRIVDDQPWTLGLVEAVAAVDILGRQRLHTRNRHALILLDSTFEIALKEFIVHRTDLFPPSQFGDKEIARLFQRRSEAVAAVESKLKLTPGLIGRTNHYYNIRNKLIHERATVEVPDVDIRNYRSVIEQVLQLLFGLNVSQR